MRMQRELSWREGYPGRAVLLPAIGAWTQYGIGMIEPWRADILGLRAHTLLTIGDMQGIVSFPSLHASSAILAMNMARGGRWLLPVLVLNLVMILSVMTEGAHYFVDMLAGVAVTVAAIAAACALLTWCERRHAVRPAPLPVLSLAAASADRRL